MDPTSILIPQLVKSLGLDLTPKVELDKLKFSEDKVSRAVERSTIAAAQKDYPTALEEAREASRAFEVLKRSVLANDGSGGIEPGETLPMTTGVNLFDLSIMVRCNLAAQLKNNGQLEESLELYTQICKMAIDQTGGGASSLLFDTSGNQQQQQSRYLLFRFGLNIGNILFESKEYQRALKYYRLTLDRLSSKSGNRNLRIKLMNNITVTLMTMNGIVVGDESHRSSSLLASSSRGTNDHVTSLQLLLADNLLDRPQNQQAQPFGLSSTSSGSHQQVSKGVDAHKHPLNSHHHKFGLNLLTCQHEGGDTSAMYSTLKSLVMVDVCHHYRRVFKCAAGQSSATDGEVDPTADREPSSQSADIDRLTGKSAHAQANARTLLSARRLSSPTDMRTDTAPLMKRSPASALNKTLAPGIDADGRCLELDQANAAARTGPVTGCPHEDRLEGVIRAKEAEIHRALIISCNLMIDLRDAHHRRQKQQGHNRRRARPYSLSTSSRVNLDDDDEHEARAGTEHVNELSSRMSADGVSSLGRCIGLLATSDLYKELIVDLKTNNVLRLLARKGRLSIALRALDEIDPYQRVSTSGESNLPGGGDSTEPLSHATTSSGGRTAKQQCSSALVATNFGLIYLLKNRVQFALDLCTRALAMSGNSGDRHKAESLVNLAKCYSKMNQTDQADRCLARACRLDKRLWLINYNRLLAKVNLGHHYDDLDSCTRESLSESSSRDAGLRPRGETILAQVQLAKLYHQSNMKRDTNDSLTSLLNASRPSPDTLLLASRLIDEDDDSGRQNLSPVLILQRSLRLHPYHLASAERLIALLIDKFDYQEARSVLLDCIRNRPDQVKWYLMYAECHRRAANYNEAIQLYKYTMELFPFDTSSIRALAKLADELGLQEEVRTCQAKLQQLSGDT